MVFLAFSLPTACVLRIACTPYTSKTICGFLKILMVLQSPTAHQQLMWLHWVCLNLMVSITYRVLTVHVQGERHDVSKLNDIITRSCSMMLPFPLSFPLSFSTISSLSSSFAFPFPTISPSTLPTDNAPSLKTAGARARPVVGVGAVMVVGLSLHRPLANSSRRIKNDIPSPPSFSSCSDESFTTTTLSTSAFREPSALAPVSGTRSFPLTPASSGAESQISPSN
ncbi:hypothetical protein BJ165DRAFT_1496350 [Panaeolus papilionaceus]|nr:hypothetical protein BJ165DRAFT_1496350 [Panaeolus papilionaceus]